MLDSSENKVFLEKQRKEKRVPCQEVMVERKHLKKKILKLYDMSKTRGFSQSTEVKETYLMEK